MPSITEARHTGEFILSEANGHRSREVVTISDSVAIKAGQVLGKVTADGKYTFYNEANSPAGTGIALAIAMQALSATATNRKVTVIARDAELNGKCLEWNAESAPNIVLGVADLLLQRLIVR
jgi:hypothetical protein